MAENNTSKMTALMRMLKRQINGFVTESMQERGIVYPCNWGVSLHTVRKAAQEFAPDHDFAKFLYGQQLREMQLAAYVIADPSALTYEELIFWGAGVVNTELAENLAFSLLSRTELVDEIVAAWLSDDSPRLLKYCALMTFAGMAKRLPATRMISAVRAAGHFENSMDSLLCNASGNFLEIVGGRLS